MAQLIKLQDYITRYEADIYRYPNQYIRLKKQQWKTYEEMLRNPVGTQGPSHIAQTEDTSSKDSKLISLMKSFKKKEQEEELFTGKLLPIDSKLDEEWELPSITGNKTPEERKQQFLDSILPLQLKWASSTIREMSYLQKNYKRETLLKYFLQRFPDTFFVMYKPIFLVKQAPVELEIILVTPNEIMALFYMEEQEESVVLGNNERFWSIREKEKERKIVNPTISLNRMGSIIKNILPLYNVSLPVTKLLLHPKGYIDITDGPTDVQVVDKRTYGKWFEKMRANKLPLKHSQLKAAGALLSHCQSTYIDRPEWQ
ncbi:NERD domain-containing protein [Sutcliffiella horikoshii]|uniref:NERD domain-containing protein n=1 Tax=Sutcliffiella horikoshii TaxID=79883 RepID=UPI001CFCF228|nr:NERD domain-containing protein [Sutcliffiella horikoshii]